MKCFEKWMTEYNLEKPVFVEKIEWVESGLLIILKEDTKEKRLVQLLFEGTLYSYVCTNESYKPQYWISDKDQYYPFYFSCDTDDIKRLKDAAEHIEEEDIVHFVIVGIDTIVEVFTSELPSVQIVK